MENVPSTSGAPPPHVVVSAVSAGRYEGWFMCQKKVGRVDKTTAKHCWLLTDEDLLLLLFVKTVVPGSPSIHERNINLGSRASEGHSLLHTQAVRRENGGNGF